MKKVLLAVGSLNVGGIENVSINIVKCLKNEDFQFDFLVFGSEKYYYENYVKSLGCKIIRVNGFSKGLISYYRELNYVLKNNGPYDIVHAHNYYSSGIIMLVAKMNKVNIRICHSHSIKRDGENKLFKKVKYWILRRIINVSSNKFVACSNNAGINLFGKHQFQKKGCILLNSVDLDALKFSQMCGETIRKSLHITEDKYVIGHIGRLVTVKNQKFLLDIFSNLKNNDKYALIIVGDGPLKQELTDYAVKLNIKESVYFLGSRTDIKDILSSFNLFVLPSYHEGLGIALIEAMANGLRCICNDNAVVDEVKMLSLCYPIKGYDKIEWIRKIETFTNDKSRYEIENELNSFSILKFKETLISLYDSYK